MHEGRAKQDPPLGSTDADEDEDETWEVLGVDGSSVENKFDGYKYCELGMLLTRYSSLS